MVTGYTGSQLLGRIGWRRQVRRTRELLALVGLADLDVHKPVDACEPLERTQIALARALADWTASDGLLILDEPTASLPDDQVHQLFSIITALRSRGITILYVSHRLSEVFEVADRVTVLRGGVVVGTRPVAGLTRQTLVDLITGPAESGPAVTGDALAGNGNEQRRGDGDRRGRGLRAPGQAGPARRRGRRRCPDRDRTAVGEAARRELRARARRGPRVRGPDRVGSAGAAVRAGRRRPGGRRRAAGGRHAAGGREDDAAARDRARHRPGARRPTARGPDRIAPDQREHQHPADPPVPARRPAPPQGRACVCPAVGDRPRRNPGRRRARGPAAERRQPAEGSCWRSGWASPPRS